MDAVNGNVPPGWPAQVHPPGSEGFEETAMAWLLDIVPAEYRHHGALRRYPAALARLAREHTEACVAAARDGFRTARIDLGGIVPPHGLEAVLDVYRQEGARLVALARAVALVETAVRGDAPSRPSAPRGPSRNR